MSEERWALPPSWQWAAAGDIAKIVGGGTPSSKMDSNFAEIGIPWITPADLTGYRESHISRGRRDLSKQGFAGSGARMIPAGSVLFSSRAPIGYCVIASNEVSTNQGFKSLVLKGDIDPGYVRHYLLSAKDYAESKASGTTFMELSGARVAELAVPLAPLPEQRRIVAKVDGLTARTARARNELDRIPTLIARYKSAVLALAFSGKLTKDWRIEMGRAALGAGGYPGGWTVRELEEISDIQGGIQVGKKRPASAELVEVCYLRVANVQRGWLNLDEIKTLNVTTAERDRLLLADGDILMNEGGDRDKLGRGWVWRAQIPECIHQNHVFRIRLNDPDFPPEYVSHYANENGQRYFIDEGTQTTNLASISKRKVAALPVPIPPTDEAAEIVRRIESAFSWLDRVAADHGAAARLLPKLDAAILAKAFRGELVPQDPNDEPASVLLERVKAEWTAAPKAKRGKQAPKTTSSKDLRTMVKNLEQVLTEAGDWVSAQDAFQQCGIGAAASTEEIEKIYAELRKLDQAGRIEAEPVNDDQGRKLHDRLRLKVV
jgi:type I restriction enzyme, S subunit